MIPSLNFQVAVNEYCKEAVQRKILTKKSANSYRSYLKTLESANGQKTIAWIKDIIVRSKRLSEFVTNARNIIDGFFYSNPISVPANQTSKVRSAFYSFALYNFSFFNAEADMLWGAACNDFELAQLVAHTAIFVTSDVVNAVKNGKIGRKENKGKGNPYASWDCMNSIRDMKNKGLTINLLYRDNNTRANSAIKRALFYSCNWGKNAKISYFRGFEACHIYDLVHDSNFYTSIMNLVLVPSALAALTDYNAYVQSVLKYRVFQLYQFTANKPKPAMPKDYHKLIWR